MNSSPHAPLTDSNARARHRNADSRGQGDSLRKPGARCFDPVALASKQIAHRLPVFQHILGPTIVIGEGHARVDAQDVVQRRQDVVHPDRAADDVLAAGQAREAKEAHFFEELRAGRTTIELLALDTAPITRD